MKRRRAERIIDRLVPILARKPRAAPLLDPEETVACGLNYAMQFEFWKREITAESQVVNAVMQALRLEGYKIAPMEREDYDRPPPPPCQ